MAEKAFPEIEVRFEPHLARVVNDDALIHVLQDGKRRASFLLARQILEEYREKFGEELRIKERSLACEIYWHYYCLIKAIAIEKRFGKKKFTTWLIRHIDVSDCGEREVDTNRIFWDILSIVF